MIERVIGPVVASDEKHITVLANGVGYSIQVADPHFTPGKETTVLIYSHWNSDKGMSLYGFACGLACSVFSLVITCPKIGPAIALALLRQVKSCTDCAGYCNK